MTRLGRSILLLLGGLAGLVCGCKGQGPEWSFRRELPHYQQVALQMEFPTVPPPRLEDLDTGATPHTIRDAERLEYWDLTLDEALRLAMCNSRTLQDLGGTVLRVPELIRTTYDPAIQETDPLYGVEAALAAFDAQLSSGLYFEKNDRRYNNTFFGQSVPVQNPNNPNGPPTAAGGFYHQEYDTWTAAISKRAATGSQFTIRKFVDFDRNNSLGNFYPGGAWDVYVEGEVRHPLLRRSGVEHNRIAGPSGRPGVINGVLVARVRTDISLAEFEQGVRDFVTNVENAYWDLYFAYRDLDAKLHARNAALETWRRIHSLYVSGQRGGEADKEAQAREQYFRFEEEVQTALTGRLVDGTRTNNGSSPGTFRAGSGVLVNERRLRLLMGLPMNESRVIRPADEPAVSPMTFDWHALSSEALIRRPELRRQRWLVKNRELDVVGNKNFLLPNLDVVGRYRFRGFGENLVGPGAVQYDSALTELGRFQEWQLGLEMSAPLGFREEHAAVRNAELRLSRARAILREQEKQIIFDLSNAVAETDRAYAVLQTAINRLVAARQQVEAVQAAYEEGGGARVEFYVVLDAQRRLADAESRYFAARVEYALALRNVCFEKGSLLDDRGVALTEGPWPRKAYRDAADLEHRRGAPRPINYTLHGPTIVSGGPVGLPAGSPAAVQELPSPALQAY